MSWGNSETPFGRAFDQNTGASFASTSTFGAAFGESTSAFNNGSASGTNAFGSTAPGAGNASGFGALFAQPSSAMAFGSNTATDDKPPFSPFTEKDPSNPSALLNYMSISAMPIYGCLSLDELRVQDYQRSRKKSTSSPGQSTFEGHAVTPFWALNTGQWPSSGGFETRNSRSAGAWNGTFAAFRQANPVPSFNNPTDQHDPSKEEGMEEFYRRFLLGEELANTQFHLYSAKSSSSGRVMNPRVLCANNAILAKSSKYFLDLLSSDIDPSDRSLSDLTDVNDVPDGIAINEYGYENDSDLDELDDLILEASKDQSSSQISSESELREDDNSAVSVTSLEQPREDEQRVNKEDGSTATSRPVGRKSNGTMHLQSLGSRHVLVKDTAFKTWYALLNYLSTGKIEFLPLNSATPNGKRQVPSSLMNPSDRPRCSSKPMYRLACKVGLDDLRDKALLHIQSNLSAHNILQEISSNLAHEHPRLLHMYLDMLHDHITSPIVIAKFPAFLKRIASGEMPQGGDILVDVYTRLMNVARPFSVLGSGAMSSSTSPLDTVVPAFGASTPQDAPAPSVSVGQWTGGHESSLGDTECGDEGDGWAKASRSGVLNTSQRSGSGKKKRR